MKKRIFWSFSFTVFWRLHIYEAIAAVFWQSEECFEEFKKLLKTHLFCPAFDFRQPLLVLEWLSFHHQHRHYEIDLQCRLL